MTAISGILKTETEFPASNNKQTDAENQREAWLRQMEMNQIALLQQAGAETGMASSGFSDKNLDKGFAAAGDNAMTRVSRTETASENGQANFLPVHPIFGQFQPSVQRPPGGERSTGQSLTSLNPTVDTDVPSSGPVTDATGLASNFVGLNGAPARQPVDADALSSLTVQVQADANTPSVRIAQAPAGASQALQIKLPTENAASQSTYPQATRASMTDQKAGSTQLAAAAIPSVAAGIAITPSQAVANPPPAAQLPPISTPSLSTSMQSASTLRNAEPEAIGNEAESAESEAATAKRIEFETREDWQKRTMHVAQIEQDVSLSIRDSSLQPAQSAQIVYHLAADLAQSGLRLRNATVNGKTMLRQAKANVDSLTEAGESMIDTIEPQIANEHARGTQHQKQKEQ